MAHVQLSFREFANQILIALSEEPGSWTDLKQLAASNDLVYKEGWIARVSIYLSNEGFITANNACRHLKSDIDDRRYAEITGRGLVEAEKLQSCAIVDQPELQIVDRKFSEAEVTRWMQENLVGRGFNRPAWIKSVCEHFGKRRGLVAFVKEMQPKLDPGQPGRPPSSRK
jgi:hypothetical protein